MDSVIRSYRDHHYRSADDRIDLYARDYGGGGPPLLLMHGLTRNSADFEPLAIYLMDHYRLIVPDQRGRGRSHYDPDPSQYQPQIYADDMFALLDGLKIDQTAMIGTSMGGLVAMMMAATQPKIAKAIVLNDIGPEISQSGLERIGSYVGNSTIFPNWTNAAKACEAIGSETFPDFVDNDWIEFARRTCIEQADGSIIFAYDPAIAAGLKGSDPDVVPPDLWLLWNKLGALPILSIRGSLSDLLTREAVVKMGERHEGPFNAAEIPQRGHTPILDEPAALAAIVPFLKEWA